MVKNIWDETDPWTGEDYDDDDDDTGLTTEEPPTP